MSAETLRRAAAEIRERAHGATCGPWTVGVDPETGERSTVYSEFIATRYATADPTIARIAAPQYPRADEDGEPEWGQTDDAAHMAAFSPEVADVLALALGQHADVHDTYDCWHEPCATVDFARAYLGEAL